METRVSLIKELKNALADDTLLSAKHDPNATIMWAKFRTVLSPQASASLAEMINSENYELHAYFNGKHNKYCYTVLPRDSSSYTPVGLGVPSGSLTPSGSHDTFLVCSGSKDGWHIYGERSQDIETWVFSSLWNDHGTL
jgi:hypothetical protein